MTTTASFSFSIGYVYLAKLSRVSLRIFWFSSSCRAFSSFSVRDAYESTLWAPQVQKVMGESGVSSLPFFGSEANKAMLPLRYNHIAIYVGKICNRVNSLSHIRLLRRCSWCSANLQILSELLQLLFLLLQLLGLVLVHLTSSMIMSCF